MNNELKKAKEANKKAMPLFIAIVVVCGIIGGFSGYFMADAALEDYSEVLRNASVYFSQTITPVLMVVLLVIVPITGFIYIRGAKNLLTEWDGEDEEVSDTVERKLSIAIWIAGAAMIAAFFLFAAFCSAGMELLDQNEGVKWLVTLIVFIGVIIEVVLIQQKSVDLTKVLYPEKTASVYDVKFQDKWLDSCDEAEKIMIGKCALKAFNAVNMVCMILTIILAIGAMVFGIGFLPSLVLHHWFVCQSVYNWEALKYLKAGYKFSA